jgi:hypothetical protein
MSNLLDMEFVYALPASSPGLQINLAVPMECGTAGKSKSADARKGKVLPEAGGAGRAAEECEAALLFRSDSSAVQR